MGLHTHLPYSAANITSINISINTESTIINTIINIIVTIIIIIISKHEKQAVMCSAELGMQTRNPPASHVNSVA